MICEQTGNPADFFYPFVISHTACGELLWFVAKEEAIKTQWVLIALLRENIFCVHK